MRYSCSIHFGRISVSVITVVYIVFWRNGIRRRFPCDSSIAAWLLLAACVNNAKHEVFDCSDISRRPYNLYCVGGDVKPCSINQSATYQSTNFVWRTCFQLRRPSSSSGRMNSLPADFHCIPKVLFRILLNSLLSSFYRCVLICLSSIVLVFTEVAKCKRFWTRLHNWVACWLLSVAKIIPV